MRAAVGREDEVAGATATCEALLLDAGGDVDDGDIVADAIGDVEGSAGLVEDCVDWFSAGGDGAHDGASGEVDYGDGVFPRIHDVELSGVGGEREAAGHVANGNARGDFAGGHVNDAQFVAAFAE